MQLKPPEACDLAILTVIGIELDAVKQAFGAQRYERDSQRMYWKGQVYSTNEGRNLNVVIGCCATAGTVTAALRTYRFLEDFSPALLILTGIAAGHKESFKLGDVVYGAKVTDLSIGQRENGIIRVRPTGHELPPEAAQLIAAFSCDSTKLKNLTEEILQKLNKPLPTPTTRKQRTIFDTQVSTSPRLKDCVIGSGNLLVRDGKAFPEFQIIDPQIRAIEMEAAGVIQAIRHSTRATAWLVVRGISDFGDENKDKFFDAQPYAAASAAAFVRLFSEGGFDKRILLGRAGIPPTPSPPTKFSTAPHSSPPIRTLHFGATIPSQAAGSVLDQKVSELRGAWVNAPQMELLARVRSLRASEAWNAASAEVQARAIRFEAEIVLALTGKFDEARLLVQEADNLAAGSRNLLARIHAEEYDPKSAAELLQHPKTLDEWNARMALLLEAEDVDSVFREWEGPPDGVGPDAESRRLHALALLTRRQFDEADKELSAAEKRKPDAFALRIARSMLEYFSALSPAAPDCVFRLVPIPIPLDFVQRDTASLKKFSDASERFKALSEALPNDAGLKRGLDHWRLACLANNIERQTEAKELCQSLLETEPGAALVLQWASARNFPVDSEGHLAALAKKLGIEL